MDETNPSSNPGASPLENALKQIQTWFVSGDFEKVKQGCEEILRIAPNNSIAQDLLRKAKEALGETGAPQMPGTPASAMPSVETPMTPPATPEMTPPVTPPETSASEMAFQPPSGEWTPPSSGATNSPPAENPSVPSFETEMVPEAHSKRSLFIQLGVLMGIFVLGMGGIYGYKTLFSDTPASNDGTIKNENPENPDDKTPKDSPKPNDPETQPAPPETDDPETPLMDAESRNSKRLKDLKTIEKALISYYQLFKAYPAPEEVNQALIDNGLLEKMPKPPTDEEAYVYAVYDNEIGDHQIYILSATFENDNGTKEAWSTGGNTLELTDYDDIPQTHVTILHPTLTEEDYLKKIESEEKPDEEPEKERVPRV